MVTRGSFYHTISGVVAQAPIREFSLPIVAVLDARPGAFRCSKALEVVLRREGRQMRWPPYGFAAWRVGRMKTMLSC